jgi:hypothetical protein
MGDHQARVTSNESFCFFLQKEALSFFIMRDPAHAHASGSFLKKRTKKLPFL